MFEVNDNKTKTKEIKHIIDSDLSLAYELLEETVKYCSVLLNRAPTLYKLSIEVILSEVNQW